MIGMPSTGSINNAQGYNRDHGYMLNEERLDLYSAKGSYTRPVAVTFRAKLNKAGRKLEAEGRVEEAAFKALEAAMLVATERYVASFAPEDAIAAIRRAARRSRSRS